jgi:hypothetical protein
VGIFSPAGPGFEEAGA